jgi:hypothetical protein
MREQAGSGARSGGLWAAVGGAVALGALSSLGDWLWARFITDGALLPGMIHGAVVFVALAAVLGTAAGGWEATRYLLVRLPLTGAAIAALFYPLAGAIGYLPALVVCWMLMWLALALFGSRARAIAGKAGGDARRGSPGSALVGRSVFLRGILAAIASGLAFWSVSGLWTDPRAATASYPERFLLWTWAFLPGFAALLIRVGDRSASGH